MNLLELKIFCNAKDTVNKTKWHPKKWEKIFTKSTSDRRVIFRIYKELKKLDMKIPYNLIKKESANLNREFSTEEYQNSEIHLKRCSTSFAIRELQIKMTLRYHLIPVRMAKIKTIKQGMLERVWSKHFHC